jgi:hypothetical protein
MGDFYASCNDVHKLKRRNTDIAIYGGNGSSESVVRYPVSCGFLLYAALQLCRRARAAVTPLPTVAPLRMQ